MSLGKLNPEKLLYVVAGAEGPNRSCQKAAVGPIVASVSEETKFLYFCPVGSVNMSEWARANCDSRAAAVK